MVVEGDLTKRKIWEVTLPVIDSIYFDEEKEVEVENNTCAELVGGVRVELLWITKKANDEAYAKIPYEYYNANDELIFESSETDGLQRWKDFCINLEIKDSSGAHIEILELKQLYFRASCESADPTGGPGGPNYGILSKRPVLVD